jgi:hypothetical protein
MTIMNLQQNHQSQKMSDHPTASPITGSPADLMKTAKPVGTFASSDDLIVRIRGGELVAADTGDQGQGQN